MHTHTHRRLGWSAIVTTGALLLPVIVHAQGGAFPVDDSYRMIANVATTVASFLNMLTWFVFVLLNFLLDPDFIFDGGAMFPMLNVIWQLSRDLMNVVFAIALIGAAIYTVVTANREFVSAHLKTFILAVVLVNFSWFIPRVILDIAHVAASTIFSIPTALVDAHPDAACRYTSSSERGCLESAALGDGNFTCACKAIADFEPFPSGDFVRDARDDAAWECHWAYCVKTIKLDASAVADHSAILNGLIINHARLPQLAMVTRVEGGGKISDLLAFVIKELIVVVIHIALFFPLLAILVALVIRIPVLWLTMAFMPFYFLSWVVPDEISFLAPFKDKAKNIMEWFIKAAFLPAAIAVPFCIGYIMANAGSRIVVDPRLGGIGFNLLDGIGNFYQVLWVVMILGVLWSGVFMVLEMMMIDDFPGKGLVQGIKSTGEQAGKFAAQLPLSTIPIPGPGNLNALGALKMFSPSGIAAASHAVARGGPGALFGGGVRDTDKIKVAASKMGDEDKEEIKVAVEDFMNHNRIDKLEDLFKKNKHLKETDVEITDSNFKEQVVNLADEMKRLGKDVTGLDNDFAKRRFENAADGYRRAKGLLPPVAPPVPPAAVPPAAPPAGAPPAAPAP